MLREGEGDGGAIGTINFLNDMKRLMTIAMLLLGLSMVFCSCNKEKTGKTSSLIGTWDEIAYYDLFDDGTREDGEATGYIVFTETKMTIFDENDWMNEIPMNYTYSNGVINIMGMDAWQVLSLSKGIMEIRMTARNLDDSYTHMTFKKR